MIRRSIIVLQQVKTHSEIIILSLQCEWFSVGVNPSHKSYYDLLSARTEPVTARAYRYVARCDRNIPDYFHKNELSEETLNYNV